MPRREPTTLTLTEAAVLCVLRIEEPHSGYELHKLAAKSVGHLWTPALSQLYATLRRLVGRSLVHGEAVAQATRPDKRVFRITDEGVSALDRWLADVEDVSQDAFVLRVFFGGLVPREVLAEHVRRFRARTHERIALYRGLADANTRRGHDWFHHRTLLLAIPSEEVSLAWADDLLRELAEPASRRRPS